MLRMILDIHRIVEISKKSRLVIKFWIKCKIIIIEYILLIKEGAVANCE